MLNKKGDIQSIIIMIVVVVMMALIVIIFSKAFLDITGELKSSSQFSNTTIETIEGVEEKTIPLLDFLVFFSLISLIIGLIISSIYIKVHPALTIIFIIGGVVAVFLAGQLANVFAEISADPELASTASQFTLTNIILGQYFPLIILIVVIIVVVILYSKRQSGEDI